MNIKKVWWMLPLALIGYIIGFQSCAEGAIIALSL